MASPKLVVASSVTSSPSITYRGFVISDVSTNADVTTTVSSTSCDIKALE